MVPFEITACNLIIHFWSEIVPTGAIIAIIIVLYAIINVTAVKWSVRCVRLMAENKLTGHQVWRD